MKNYKKKTGVSLIIFVLGILSILGFTGLVIDVGMILLAQNELQKITETSALVGASSLEPKEVGANIMIQTTNVDTLVTDTFNKMKTGNALINSASIQLIQTKGISKAVRVTASASASTYILGLVGINKINIVAQAAAISAPFYMSPNFPRLPSKGSALTATTQDTEIAEPIGNNSNQNTSISKVYGFPDGNALSLGPDGYITFRLPVPLENMEGPDLYVKELGNKEGYFVYAGIPRDATDPYISYDSYGAGINWVNISCTGTPTGTTNAGMIGPYNTTAAVMNGYYVVQTKFYGSGVFDIGKKCYDADGTLSYDGSVVGSASFIKIIDDGVEDGFMYDDPTTPVLLVGEHSSVTPGADIDAIGVLHHSRIISPKEFSSDSDNDGLINQLEDVLGTNKFNADSDGDSVSDGIEFIGWYYVGAVATAIIDAGSNHVYFTDPMTNDSAGMGKIKLP